MAEAEAGVVDWLAEEVVVSPPSEVGLQVGEVGVVLIRKKVSDQSLKIN